MQWNGLWLFHWSKGQEGDNIGMAMKAAQVVTTALVGVSVNET